MSTTESLSSPLSSAQATPASRRKILVTIAVASAAVLATYMLYRHFMYVSTDNAKVQAKTVMLSSRVNGYVVKIAVEENERVKAGQVLAEIDSRDYQNSFEATNKELSSVEARLRDAEKNYRRLSDLFKSGAISQQAYDNAEAQYREVSNRYKSMQAQVSQAQLNVDYTQIKAPSDGVVARRSVEVGMLAAVGTPLFGFVSSESRWVEANFKETEVRDVQLGKKVDIEVDAIPRRSFEGVVESISPATGATFTLLPPDNATGNFTKVVQRVPVRIKLVNLSAEDIYRLQAGLSANVSVHIH